MVIFVVLLLSEPSVVVTGIEVLIVARMGHCLCVRKRYLPVDEDGCTSMSVRSPSRPRLERRVDGRDTARRDLMGCTWMEDT